MWVQSRSLLGFLWELYRAGFTIALTIRSVDLLIQSLNLFTSLISVDCLKM